MCARHAPGFNASYRSWKQHRLLLGDNRKRMLPGDGGACQGAHIKHQIYPWYLTERWRESPMATMTTGTYDHGRSSF